MAEKKDSKDDKKRPIIIKKIKKVSGHGHHGGAWKVAYADFVTAMMAFFLLLWLISTSSKDTLAGLAEYFTPTEGIKDSQGIGFKGGKSDDDLGTMKNKLSAPGLVSGRTPTGVAPDNPENQSQVQGDQEANLFKQGATALEQKFTHDTALQQFRDNVSAQQTPDGLQIDIMDSDKYSMFDRGTARLTTQGRLILGAMVPIVKKMPNFITITGHTDASPAETGQAEYTNWELSADRAQTVRRFLLDSGLEQERTQKVIGMADRQLYTPQDPRGPKNRRVALVLLKGSHILIPDAALPKAQESSGNPSANPSVNIPIEGSPVPPAAGAKKP